MKGISITRQPSSRSAEERAPACFFARETRMRHPARGKTRREMFVRGLFAKVGVLRLRRRKTSAASAQDDTMTALRTDYRRLATDSCFLRLLGRRCCRAIHLFENPGGASAQQRVANFFAQRNRVAAALLLAQNLRAIRTRNDRSYLQI